MEDITKEWLENAYVKQGLYPTALAAEAGCSCSTIYRRLHKFSIPIHGKRVVLEKDWLIGKYITEKQSAYQIARGVGCSSAAIYDLLNKYAIPVRPLGEAFSLAKANHLDLSASLMDLLEGELLGDGCLRSSSKFSSLFSISSKYKEYIIWLRQQLNDNGLIPRQIYKEQKGKYVGYHYATLSYTELAGLRRKWYPDGKKIIPRDFILTPIKALHWYIGDGSYVQVKKQWRPHIRLATNGFSDKDRVLLIDKLASIGVESHAFQSGELYITTDSTPTFLQYTGACPNAIKAIYGYKWPE